MARILFVSHTSELGGPTRSLLKLLKYIDGKYEVAVAAPGNGAVFGELEEMGIPSYRAGRHGLTRRSIPWLCQLIIRREFDLIYGNNYSSGPRNALIAAKLTGRPFIWHIRELLKESAHWRTAFFLRYADVIIAVSQASVQSVKHHVAPQNVHLVYNGVELQEFQAGVKEARRHVRSILGLSPDHLVIANVGHVCARKGQMYAVKAAAGVLKNHPNVGFAFLGDLNIEPEYADKLQRQASQMRGKAQFLGFRQDVHRFLVGCDLLLHTAAWDPNPRIVYEAMAAKLPVVAFNVDGVKEQIVDGETGYLIPHGDVNALTKVLTRCLKNQELRYELGMNGQKRVEDFFTADKTAGQIARIIDDLLNGCDPYSNGMQKLRTSTNRVDS